jgi:hypothetical protein
VVALAVAAAVVIGLIVAFTGNSAPSPASAGAPRPGGGGAGPVGPTAVANETAARVAVVATGGTISAGPLVGPDGRVWVVTTSASGQSALKAVSPANDAVTTYALPGSLDGSTMAYNGGAAWDGAGNLWLGAEASQSSYALVRYTPGSGTAKRFPAAGNCTTGQPSVIQNLAAAADGAVWGTCEANAANSVYGETAYFRVTSDGDVTPVQLTGDAEGTVDLLWPLTPAPGGAMWAAGGNGSVQFSPAGTETAVPGQNVSFQNDQILGNGTAGMESLAQCTTTSGGLITQVSDCVNTVSAGGAESTIATLPAGSGAENGGYNLGVMDSSGNAWAVYSGTAGGKAPQGQFLAEVGPGGAMQFFPFTVPNDNGLMTTPALLPPAVTAGGVFWTDDTASNYPGALVEITPKS